VNLFSNRVPVDPSMYGLDCDLLSNNLEKLAYVFGPH